MARKKSKPVESGYALFDVLYEDGSRSSNRRVPRSILGGLDGDEPARKAIEEQDNTIAEKAGRPRIAIKKITRSPAWRALASRAALPCRHWNDPHVAQIGRMLRRPTEPSAGQAFPRIEEPVPCRQTTGPGLRSISCAQLRSTGERRLSL